MNPITSRLGCDLEYAVYDDEEKMFVPAGFFSHLITGVKGQPDKLKDSVSGVEIDCCAVETTPAPAVTEDGFCKSILTTLAEVRAKFERPEIHLVTKPSHVFNQEILQSAPFAMTMGCQPDFNAWTGKRNPQPNSKNKCLRSFGGHIHIEGGTRSTIKACDLILGMWSVLQDPDKFRRELYGKAGAYRPKPYGVEYRVLSNFWCDDEKKIRSVYRMTRLAQQLEMEEVNKIVAEFGGEADIQIIINTSERFAAQEILQRAVGVTNCSKLV